MTWVYAFIFPLRFASVYLPPQSLSKSESWGGRGNSVYRFDAHPRFLLQISFLFFLTSVITDPLSQAQSENERVQVALRLLIVHVHVHVVLALGPGPGLG